MGARWGEGISGRTASMQTKLKVAKAATSNGPIWLWRAAGRVSGVEREGIRRVYAARVSRGGERVGGDDGGL